MDSQVQGSGAPTALEAAPFVNRRDPALRLGPDGRLAVSRRAPIWADVPDEKWNDWRWQLSNRVNDLAEIEPILELTDEEREGLSAPDKFRVDVTPYFISLIDPKDPDDPIRRQIIPLGRELRSFTGMMEDSLAEDRHSPVPGLVHRYPDRVLMLITTQCAVYCRYCTRSRIVGDATQNFNRKEHEAQLDYIRRTPQIRDVLISGGDGLTLAPKLLESALRGLREIPHVEVVRIGSRVPVFMPQRIDDELCEMLGKYHPLWLNIHVNHPDEITPELARACDKLSRAGIPLGNQSVLLAGVNDCVHTQRELVQRLVEIRVRPYYLYQCDLVEGAGHFRTPIGKGLEIIEGLRGHTSGFAVPQFIVDAPGGGGKIPVMPNYVVSYSDHKVILRNYEGYITTYEEPAEYTPHDSASCTYCRNPRPEPGQEGITGLLDGKRMWIEPAGFAQVHERGNTEAHRLSDPSKWVPFGVGAIEGQSAEGGRALPVLKSGPKRRGRRRATRSRPDDCRDTAAFSGSERLRSQGDSTSFHGEERSLGVNVAVAGDGRPEPGCASTRERSAGEDDRRG